MIIGVSGSDRARSPGQRDRDALLLVDRPDLPAAIVPAVTADGVRELEFVALRALARPHGFEGVVRPALGRPRFGMASFGIRHMTGYSELVTIARF
jgi:hypothetical protein